MTIQWGVFLSSNKKGFLAMWALSFKYGYITNADHDYTDDDDYDDGVWVFLLLDKATVVLNGGA